MVAGREKDWIESDAPKNYMVTPHEKQTAIITATRIAITAKYSIVV